MRVTVLAVGLRMPNWAEEAWRDYDKRFPPDFRVSLKPIKAEPRLGKTPEQCMKAESLRIQSALDTLSSPWIVALDERGRSVTTQALAQHMEEWRQHHSSMAFLIGGADGLWPTLKQSAHASIRLSDLTLPHAMARVLLVEQLYRAWSISHHHPYHRE